MRKSLQALDYSVDVSSGAYGIANIQSILGIILLVLSICSVLYKMGLAIYTHFKNKEYKEIAEVLDKTKEEIEKIKDGGNDGN